MTLAQRGGPAGAAIAACYIPALRATKLEPRESLIADR